ncbi:MAG: VWD domain-containing protein [Patescibacteria group bacterium]|nr:VWD domain-containing protein [Patescibacteria group bacterium]
MPDSETRYQRSSTLSIVTVGIILVSTAYAMVLPVISHLHAAQPSATSALRIEATISIGDPSKPVLTVRNTGEMSCALAETAVGTVSVTRMIGDGIPVDALELQVALDDAEELLRRRMIALAPGQSREIPLSVVSYDGGVALQTIAWSAQTGAFGAIYPFDPAKPYQLDVSYHVPDIPQPSEMGDIPSCGTVLASTQQRTSGPFDWITNPIQRTFNTLSWPIVVSAATVLILIVAVLVRLYRRKKKTRKHRPGKLFTVLLAAFVLAGALLPPLVQANYNINESDGGRLQECLDLFDRYPDITGPILDRIDEARIEIFTNRRGENYATDYPDGSFHVHWDPESEYNYYSEGAPVPSTPCDRLFHELYHVYDMMNNTFSRGICGASGIETKEVMAVRAQNRLREAMGLPPRTHYGRDRLPEGECTEPPDEPSDCTGARCGSSKGDPHLRTLDGARYSFQAVGEFVLVRAGTDFEVQVRQQPWYDSRQVAITRAVAVRTGTDIVELRLERGQLKMVVNGEFQQVRDMPLSDPAAISVTSGRRIVISGPDRASVVIQPGGSLSLDVTVNPPERTTGIEGLLGNGNGTPEDDLVRRGTKDVLEPSFENLYPAFADSWRVTGDSTLFTYDPGMDTNTYTDRSFPDAPARPEDAPNRVFAEAVCRDTGVTDEVIRNSCIVDVGFTGRPEFAVSALADQRESRSRPAATAGERLSPGELTTDTTAARFPFRGTTNERVFVDITGTGEISRCGGVRIESPSGERIATGCVLGGQGHIDTVTLPQTGDYAVVFEDWEKVRQTARINLIRVTDLIRVITPDGPAVPVNLDTPGMHAELTFAGMAGTKVYIDVPETTFPAQCGGLLLLDPTGERLETGCILGDTGSIDTAELPATGTYTIRIDPSDRDTGTTTVRLTTVRDFARTVALNDPPLRVRLDNPGARASITFEGTAGKTVQVIVTESTLPSQCGGFHLEDATGARIVSDCILNGTGTLGDKGIVLPATGRYTVIIDPSGKNTGEATVSIRQ